MEIARLVCGLTFGDEHKGHLVDYLTDKYQVKLVVRFNGGAQAAHTVVLDDGRKHTFSMYGSGTLAGASTYLGPHVRVDPRVICEEAVKLHKLMRFDFYRVQMLVAIEALVVTRFHRERSTALATEHNRGTCGMGVGETARFAARFEPYALRIGDFRSRGHALEKLRFIAHHYTGKQGWELEKLAEEEYNALRECLALWVIPISIHEWARIRDGRQDIIFEGAQGALLHNELGYKPYVTSSDTSFKHAYELIEGSKANIVRWGCLRSYITRHGPGPLPTEDPELKVPEPDNSDDVIQGRFRRGWFDMKEAFHGYGIMGGVDQISISHLDCWQHGWMAAISLYGQGGPRYELLRTPASILDHLENCFPAPVALTSYGPKRGDFRG